MHDDTAAMSKVAEMANTLFPERYFIISFFETTRVDEENVAVTGLKMVSNLPEDLVPTACQMIGAQWEGEDLSPGGPKVVARGRIGEGQN